MCVVNVFIIYGHCHPSHSGSIKAKISVRLSLDVLRVLSLFNVLTLLVGLKKASGL